MPKRAWQGARKTESRTVTTYSRALSPVNGGAAVAPIQQVDEGPDRSPEFTNHGKPERKKKPAKPAKKLTRVPFQVSRLAEFCSERELVNQTGHCVKDWPLVVLKELVDNALDECEEAGIPPVIDVTVSGDKITVTDNGRGIPAKTIASALDYSIRVSSREAYVSPTRGAQGNALKTILPMGYVLDGSRGEDAAGETVIEAHGVAHCIGFAVDHIRQEPRIEHATEPSAVAAGTRITVTLPGLQRWDNPWTEKHRRDRFTNLARSYAWLNPHLSLRVTWNGAIEVDVTASDPAWSKWLPSWPTSAHWYDKSRFRRYMAAHIAHRGDTTVRQFISELDGLSGTAKQKAVLAETGASHVALHDFFGRTRANVTNIAKLLESCKRHSKPVTPARLGTIGKSHLYQILEAAGGEPATFTYTAKLADDDGLPRVLEFAFGVHKEGLVAGVSAGRLLVTGVNWSPGINNPFRQLGRNGEGLDAILSQVRADSSRPVIAVLHLACPRIAYTDRGKSAIVVDGEADE